MSTDEELAACDTASAEAERLAALEGQMQELADKTRTQKLGSMETKRCLEDLKREAEKQKNDIVGMLAEFTGSNPQDGGNKTSPEATIDEQPAGQSCKLKDEKTLASRAKDSGV